MSVGIPGGRLLSLVLLAGLLAGCGRQTTAEHVQLFEQAQEVFNTAKTPDDYRKAAGMYQQLLDDGVVNGMVFYNQGNAFMRAGDLGRAIASYRQAMPYRPNDPLLLANYRAALEKGSHTPQAKPVLDGILFWQDWISYPSKFILVMGATIVTFLVALAVLLGTSNRILLGISVAMVVVTSIMTVSAVYDWYRFEIVKHGVLVVPSVTARKGNSMTYEPAFQQELREGTEFYVVEKRGDWLRIQMPGGAEGWIEAKDAVQF